jgi:exopolysaccharide biosynthesis polyprenyl glycosylphosphotransferase
MLGREGLAMEGTSATAGTLEKELEHGTVVARRHAPRDFVTRRVLAGSDLLAVVVTVAALALLVPGEWNRTAILIGLAFVPVWLALFKAYGAYDRDIRRVSHTAIDDLPWLFHATLTGTVVLSLVLHAATASYDLLGAVGLATGTIVLVFALRLVARRVLRRVLGPERVVVIGQGPDVSMLVRKMRAHAEYGLAPVGVVVPEGHADGVGLPVLRTLGEDGEFAGLIRAHRIHRVVLCHAGMTSAGLLDLMRECKALGVKVSLMPELFAALGSSVEVDDVEGVTVLGVNPPVLPRTSRWEKRAVDILGSVTLLVITAPLFALIATAIKLDSRGPVLFRQTRIGKGGRCFRLLKFRTMVVGAERQQEQLRKQSLDSGWLLIENDPRVTRVGRWLRLSSLDELPQLLNIVKGEMSLVGPRPLIESEASQLEQWARTRIDLTPGLTGLWQVLGRTNIPFEEMLKLDYLYVTNWSLWGDVRLIMRTLLVVARRSGAN